MSEKQSAFAPQLITQDGAAAIEFYKKALGTEEVRRWNNDDGTVHVAELSLGGTLFHLREESSIKGNLSPVTAKGNTVIIGLFVNDVDSLVEKAVAAGAILESPPQDYDYHYRQSTIKDPFGHQWLIEKKI